MLIDVSRAKVFWDDCGATQVCGHTQKYIPRLNQSTLSLCCIGSSNVGYIIKQ
ncbi:MAG: hypothetical protein JWO38_2299 [Gemmataceae bacterium]|nr:hypothetical protein [Gemmataceae bacterium]